VELATPTIAHVIYIPMVLMVGVVCGCLGGGRAAADAMAMDQKRREERAARTNRP
jgi:hypothetical protein